MPLPGGVRRHGRAAARRGALAGAAWIALAGALRQYRGVNETISSLLLAYIAIALFKHFVEGPLRDPASLNKPSTLPLDEALRIGGIAGYRRALGPGLRRGGCAWLPALWLGFTTHGLRDCAWSAATRARRGWSGCRPTG